MCALYVCEIRYTFIYIQHRGQSFALIFGKCIDWVQAAQLSPACDMCGREAKSQPRSTQSGSLFFKLVQSNLLYNFGWVDLDLIWIYQFWCFLCKLFCFLVPSCYKCKILIVFSFLQLDWHYHDFFLAAYS